ncbi:MAG TPA: FAD-dependent monooxygenase [Burkholderiaceae bacterium]|nr:FAD-dependent monooxygenase [Burkholderiaceae bacterium]
MGPSERLSGGSAAQRVEVCIRGAGIVGRTLALALSHQGLRVALQAEARAADARADVRAYALNAASVALLEQLKVWPALPVDARTAVHDMRIEGGGRAALSFSAWQQAVRELAWIVDAAALEAELDAALRYAPNVQRVEAAVDAPLVVLAEGRASATREALGVAFEMHDYGQRAIAARLSTDVPHDGLARQWFRAPDVLALLPIDRPAPGAGFALVWSLPNARADAMLALDDAAFEAELNAATGGAAGMLRLTSERRAWPLALARAERVCGPGWVLVGDAAHLIHPLAGQGLNLGLADVAALARVVAEREPWRALGDARLLERYARERAGPTLAMARLTDGLWQLFAHPSPWARELRERGLGLVQAAAPIKRWLAAQAFGR